MKVRMLSFETSSPDGITVNVYRPGEKHDLPERLAQSFIDRGTAAEDKDMGHAPETKTTRKRK